MLMRRRTILGGIGSTVPATLAGCGDLIDSGDDESEESHEQSGNATESNASDNESIDEQSDTDDEQLHEDESIAGEVIVSEDLRGRLEALRHTYTWKGDSQSNNCSVHVELENVGDEEVSRDVEARIYDEEGAELASSYYPDEVGPGPGETEVYSFSLSNCRETAAYELEIGGFSNESGGSDTLLIDNFEAYDRGYLSSWTVDGGGTAELSPSAALHEDSSQGLRQDGDSNVRSFPGQGLANYPEDGREVSVLMHPDPNTAQPWILVGMEDDVWSTETPGWRLIIDPDGSIRIARETGNGAEILDEDARLPSFVGETVDCRFIADSADGFEFWIQDLDGSVLGLVSTDETDGIEDEMSIGLRSTQGVDWDWLRLVDESQ